MSKNSNNTFQIETEDSPIGAVINFLDKNLLHFPSDFKKRTSNPETVRETLISQELKIYLNRKSSDEVFSFEFEWEQEDSKRSPDLAVITVKDNNPFSFTKAFFVIEAKRLPTGLGERKKEYVKGNLGGIQRYKKGHHGNELSQSAMIGYVQDKDCNHWYLEINKWINDLIKTNTETDISWEKSDLLEEISNFGKTRKYSSKNTRIVESKKDSIELHHYLMELN
jgi:hypothetical protein